MTPIRITLTVVVAGLMTGLVLVGRGDGLRARAAREFVLFALASVLVDGSWGALIRWIDPRDPRGLVVPMYATALALALLANRVESRRWRGDFVRMCAWASCFVIELALGTAHRFTVNLGVSVLFLLTVGSLTGVPALVRLIAPVQPTAG